MNYDSSELATAIRNEDTSEIDRLLMIGHRINHPQAMTALIDCVPELPFLEWLSSRGLETYQLAYRIHCKIHSYACGNPDKARQLFDRYRPLQQYLILSGAPMYLSPAVWAELCQEYDDEINERFQQFVNNINTL